METITRFAPSPQAFFILVGKNALFNFLHAKSSGGKFRIRIEDTDQTRNKRIDRFNLKGLTGWV